MVTAGRCRADNPAALRASEVLLLRSLEEGELLSDDAAARWSLSCFRRGTSLNALFDTSEGDDSSMCGKSGLLHWLLWLPGVKKSSPCCCASKPLKLVCFPSIEKLSLFEGDSSRSRDREWRCGSPDAAPRALRGGELCRCIACSMAASSSVASSSTRSLCEDSTERDVEAGRVLEVGRGPSGGEPILRLGRCRPTCIVVVDKAIIKQGAVDQINIFQYSIIPSAGGFDFD